MPPVVTLLGVGTAGAVSGSAAYSSASINSAGTELTLTFTAAVTRGSGYSDANITLAVTNGAEGTSSSGAGSGTGNAATVTYSSGDGSTALVYTLSRTFNLTAVETCTVSIAQPGDGLEDNTTGDDVSAVSAQAVTNSSTAQTYTTRHARITPGGGIQGIGYDGTVNGPNGDAIQARGRTSILRNDEPGFAFVPTRVGLNGKQSGSPTNQEVFVAIYQPATTTATGMPDDRLGSVVGGKYSDDFPTSGSSSAQVTWNLTGIGAIADDDYYMVVAYVGSLFSSSNYMGFEYVGFGNLDTVVINNDTTPSSPNDAANWSLYDTGGELDTEVWSSP